MFWIHLFAAFSLIYDPLFAQNHNLVVKDYTLVGHVFQTLRTDDWLSCIKVCMADERCISYNYDQKGLRCELNECEVEDVCGLNEWLTFSSGFLFQQLRRKTGKVVHIYIFCLQS